MASLSGARVEVDRLEVEWAVASRPLPGEPVSGDSQLVAPFPGGALVAVVDGLGHGDAATAAANLAIATLRERPGDSVISLVNRCHERLRDTRGVVMSLASLREADSTLTWLGVGNVDGMLLRTGTSGNPSREDILLRAGVVGYQLPAPRALVIPVLSGDLLVMATDGIDSRFKEDVAAHLAPLACAERILARYAKPNDDALVLVARILRIPDEHRFE